MVMYHHIHVHVYGDVVSIDKYLNLVIEDKQQ